MGVTRVQRPASPPHGRVAPTRKFPASVWEFQAYSFVVNNRERFPDPPPGVEREQWDQRLAIEVGKTWEKENFLKKAYAAMLLTGSLIFCVVGAFLLRDLFISARDCTQSARFAMGFCLLQVDAATERLALEVLGFVGLGVTVGLGFATWRRRFTRPFS